MSKEIQACMTIAGSDPSGGAGIQADLKTFAAIGVYGCAAITCLTAQNSKGVSSCQTVSGNFIQQQINLVLEDLTVSHIKIGMVGSQDAGNAISCALANFKGQIIYDPVFKASDGSDLLDDGARPDLIERIIPIATVITPNLPELQILTNHPCTNHEMAVHEAAHLLGRFPNLEAIVLTGGHFSAESDQISDFLIQRHRASQVPEITQHTHDRIKTNNSHGTGCTFSSALTAFHFQYGNLKEAFFHAVELMDQVLCKSTSYHGGLQHHLIAPPKTG